MLLDQRDKLLQGVRGLGINTVDHARPANHLPERILTGDRGANQQISSGATDATTRVVKDPQQIDFIGGVDHEAQVGDGILDLLAIEKLLSADQHVRDLGKAQFLFKDHGLGVGAHQNSMSLISHLLCAYIVIDSLNHRPGFIFSVETLDHTDLFTLGTRRPERFVFTLLVVFNHLVGSVEDIGRRAIILLHFDDVSPGKVLFKIEDIARISAAPAIDRLIIITDHAEVVPLAGEPLHQGELGDVGILILINHDVLKTILVACLNLGEFVK